MVLYLPGNGGSFVNALHHAAFEEFVSKLTVNEKRVFYDNWGVNENGTMVARDEDWDENMARGAKAVSDYQKWRDQKMKEDQGGFSNLGFGPSYFTQLYQEYQDGLEAPTLVNGDGKDKDTDQLVKDTQNHFKATGAQAINSRATPMAPVTHNAPNEIMNRGAHLVDDSNYYYNFLTNVYPKIKDVPQNMTLQDNGEYTVKDPVLLFNEGFTVPKGVLEGQDLERIFSNDIEGGGPGTGLRMLNEGADNVRVVGFDKLTGKRVLVGSDFAVMVDEGGKLYMGFRGKIANRALNLKDMADGKGGIIKQDMKNLMDPTASKDTLSVDDWAAIRDLDTLHSTLRGRMPMVALPEFMEFMKECDTMRAQHQTFTTGKRAAGFSQIMEMQEAIRGGKSFSEYLVDFQRGPSGTGTPSPFDITVGDMTDPLSRDVELTLGPRSSSNSTNATNWLLAGGKFSDKELEHFANNPTVESEQSNSVMRVLSEDEIRNFANQSPEAQQKIYQETFARLSAPKTPVELLTVYSMGGSMLGPMLHVDQQNGFGYFEGVQDMHMLEPFLGVYKGQPYTLSQFENLKIYNVPDSIVSNINKWRLTKSGVLRSDQIETVRGNMDMFEHDLNNFKISAINPTTGKPYVRGITPVQKAFAEFAKARDAQLEAMQEGLPNQEAYEKLLSEKQDALTDAMAKASGGRAAEIKTNMSNFWKTAGSSVVNIGLARLAAEIDEHIFGNELGIPGTGIKIDLNKNEPLKFLVNAKITGDLMDGVNDFMRFSGMTIKNLKQVRMALEAEKEAAIEMTPLGEMMVTGDAEYVAKVAADSAASASAAKLAADAAKGARYVRGIADTAKKGAGRAGQNLAEAGKKAAKDAIEGGKKAAKDAVTKVAKDVVEGGKKAAKDALTNVGKGVVAIGGKAAKGTVEGLGKAADAFVEAPLRATGKLGLKLLNLRGFKPVPGIVTFYLVDSLVEKGFDEIAPEQTFKYLRDESQDDGLMRDQYGLKIRNPNYDATLDTVYGFDKNFIAGGAAGFTTEAAGGLVAYLYMAFNASITGAEMGVSFGKFFGPEGMAIAAAMGATLSVVIYSFGKVWEILHEESVLEAEREERKQAIEEVRKKNDAYWKRTAEDEHALHQLMNELAGQKITNFDFDEIINAMGHMMGRHPSPEFLEAFTQQYEVEARARDAELVKLHNAMELLYGPISDERFDQEILRIRQNLGYEPTHEDLHRLLSATLAQLQEKQQLESVFGKDKHGNQIHIDWIQHLQDMKKVREEAEFRERLDEKTKRDDEVIEEMKKGGDQSILDKYYHDHPPKEEVKRDSLGRPILDRTGTFDNFVPVGLEEYLDGGDDWGQ